LSIEEVAKLQLADKLAAEAGDDLQTIPDKCEFVSKCGDQCQFCGDELPFEEEDYDPRTTEEIVMGEDPCGAPIVLDKNGEESNRLLDHLRDDS